MMSTLVRQAVNVPVVVVVRMNAFCFPRGRYLTA